MRRLTAAALTLALMAGVSVADAAPKRFGNCIPDNNGRMVCGFPGGGTGGFHARVGIVAHPAGCPRRLFCGCGVSVAVFGKPVRNLYLARNWLRFPRARAAPGMVAYRERRGGGHVMLIRRVNGDGTALVYDPNSGGGKTRVHVRSLRGYAIVNPHASQVAAR